MRQRLRVNCPSLPAMCTIASNSHCRMSSHSKTNSIVRDSAKTLPDKCPILNLSSNLRRCRWNRPQHQTLILQAARIPSQTMHHVLPASKKENQLKLSGLRRGVIINSLLWNPTRNPGFSWQCICVAYDLVQYHVANRSCGNPRTGRCPECHLRPLRCHHKIKYYLQKEKRRRIRILFVSRWKWAEARQQH